MSGKETKKTKASANYSLEACHLTSQEEGLTLWVSIMDGFISPAKALEFAENEKICGRLRVVRVAIQAHGGMESVYTLDKTNNKTNNNPVVSKHDATKVKTGDSVEVSSFDSANPSIPQINKKMLNLHC